MAIIVLAMPAVMAATAQGAQSYGELTRFGKLGKAKGQFTTGSAGVVGVDPTDNNSVYVGDEPKGTAETNAEYRIQKFTSAGKFVASASFKLKAEGPEGGAPAGLEGIAVDPSLKRVYALVAYEREEEAGPKREKEIEKGEALPRIDATEPAAGVIYAFSTVQAGEVLPPASNEGKAFPEGVLADTEALHAQSEVTGKPTESALLEASGIAVDPTTKDIVILGTEDPGEEERRSAAQRVSPAGALGARWVDTTNCFEGEGSEICEEAGAGSIPTSPVVTQTGRVLVSLSGSEIWEIPKTFVSSQLPKPVLQPDLLQNIFEFPGNPLSSQGGALAFVHDPALEGETEGLLYTTAAIKTTSGRFPGVSAFRLTDSGGGLTTSELGWTGGRSQAENPDESCAIGVFSPVELAVGTGETVFVFDPGKQASGPPANPHVVAFGPKPPAPKVGPGCPTATADGPKATLNGQELGTVASPAHVGDKVALSSNVTQANALSADWNFGDGSTASEPKYQYQTTRIEHAFTKSGTFAVEETIHTDNLAEPTIVEKASVIVAAAKPIAQFSGPSAVTAGQTAAFDAKGSSDPNGSKIVEYKWNFGDGAETTTTSASVTHQYTAVGPKTVSLQVVDELKLTSDSVKHPLTVNAAGGGGGGGGAGGGSGGGGGGETPAPTPTPGAGTASAGATGVQGSQAAKMAPEAKLASSSLAVSPTGGVAVKVTCPAGATNCAGTVTLRTLGAVSAQAGKKKAVLTLATGSFTVGGGSAKSLTLHLSAKARKLLAHSHVLRARATVLAHDATGATHTTLSTVTLKLAKKAAHH